MHISKSSAEVVPKADQLSGVLRSAEQTGVGVPSFGGTLAERH